MATSVRHKQIEATFKRRISDILVREMNDPRIRGLVSVMGVEMSMDRRRAVVEISVIPQKYEKRTLAALKSAATMIHRKVFKAVGMKMVPQFEFRIDSTMKKQAEIFSAIADGLGEDKDRQDQRENDDEFGDQFGGPDVDPDASVSAAETGDDAVDDEAPGDDSGGDIGGDIGGWDSKENS